MAAFGPDRCRANGRSDWLDVQGELQRTSVQARFVRRQPGRPVQGFFFLGGGPWNRCARTRSRHCPGVASARVQSGRVLVAGCTGHPELSSIIRSPAGMRVTCSVIKGMCSRSTAAMACRVWPGSRGRITGARKCLRPGVMVSFMRSEHGGAIGQDIRPPGAGLSAAPRSAGAGLGGIELLLGREQIREAPGPCFIAVHDSLRDQDRQPERVDMRYTNGLAISWIKSDQPAQAAENSNRDQ